MRAVVVPRTGGPEVLELRDADTPTAGPGQVVVDVAAAGVNFIDTYQREGRYPVATPFVLGLEGAGRVAEVGLGVDRVAIGELVAWKDSFGSYAEQVAVAADDLIPVPDGVPDDLAAALPLQGLTAHYLASSTYEVQPGDWVVVHAAAGGVGLLLTQIVKLRGGHVLATVSTREKAELAESAGADAIASYEEFVDRARELTGGEGVACVYDGVGASTFLAGFDALRVRGTMVLYGGASGRAPQIDPMTLNAKGSLYLTRPTLGHYTRDRSELLTRAADLFGWVAGGKLRVRVGARYPLAEARQAHEDLQARRTTGKLLLVP